MKLTLGHTPDPDDAFLLYALLHDRVDMEGLEFEEILEPIVVLNDIVRQGAIAVSALSVALLPDVSDRYEVLPSGACMAENRGPVLVFGGGKTPQVASGPGLERGLRVAVPGLSTTASLALRLFRPDLHLVTLPSDQIMKAVEEGAVPAGVLINVDQILAMEKGLRYVDLGAWWQEKSGFPLPLGIDVVNRSLNDDVRGRVARVFRRSVEYAFAHPREAFRFASRFGRHAGLQRAEEFVVTYVGSYSLDLGARGREAIITFLRECAAAGLVKRGDVRFAKGSPAAL